eukprot:COSAG01_NODE_231_length_21019_cov_104.980501_18_plen_321_part_00
MSARVTALPCTAALLVLTHVALVVCSAAANKVGHVMLLGDNFYGSGIHGDDTSCRFKKTFEDVYSAASLKDIPFYAIAGNHDHGGNVSAQIAYTADQTRWKYPDWFYSFNKSFVDPATSKTVTVDFFMIDTVIAGALDNREYGPELQEEHSHLKYLPEAAPSAAEQWAWLEKRLAASTADYVWVGGHHPVWSGCEHGPTLGLVLKLKPMLEKYGVSGYMCGHDHCEEHIDEGKGPVYVLTGSGFECCYPAKNAHRVPAGAIKMAYWKGECPSGAHCPPMSPNTAFTVFDVSASQMTVTYIDSAGKTLFKSPPIKPRARAH